MPSIGTGVSAGLSIFSAMSADDAASDQAAMGDWMAAVGLEQWNLYKEIYLPYERAYMESMMELLPQYEEYTSAALQQNLEAIQRYQEMGYPLEEAMIAAAEAGIQDRSAAVTRQAAADVDAAYDVQAESERLRQSRYGIEPTSGAGRSRQRELDIARAGDRASSINRAREAEIQRQEQAAIQYPAAALGAMRGNYMAPGILQGRNPITPSVPYQYASGAAGIYGDQSQAYGQAAGSLAQFAFSDTAQNFFPFKHGGMVPGYAGGGPVMPGGPMGVPRFGPAGYAQGGMAGPGGMTGEGTVVGPGGPMSDSVPATVNTGAGIEPARLSAGEYVIPAQVVDQIVTSQVNKLAGIEGGPKK